MATRRVVLHFPPTLIDEPIISAVIRGNDLDFNILRADITPDREGLMIIVFEGEEKALDSALDDLQSRGVVVEPMARGITRNEERCTECGACVTICPTQALVIDIQTRHVIFEPEKCIACKLCVPVCPPRAMQLDF